MSSLINQIIEIGKEIGHDFTTREMAELIYGSVNKLTVSNTSTKIQRLVRQKIVIESKTEIVGCNRIRYYKVVE